MAENVTSACRRFQFRLRTLMIVVALFGLACAFVGSKAKIVRDRKDALTNLKNASAGVSTNVSGGQFVVWTDSILGHDGANHNDKRIPLLRRLMGDVPIFWIIYKRGTTDDEIRRLRKLFPESIIDGEDSLFPDVRPATQP